MAKKKKYPIRPRGIISTISITKILDEKEKEMETHKNDIFMAAVKYAMDFDTRNESIRSHILKAYEDGRRDEWRYQLLNTP
jgi:hypothetical protein